MTRLADSALHAVRVIAPATTANLGPGFDCLGLTLDLWNTATFTLGGEGIEVHVVGEGSDVLPRDAGNLMVRAFRRLLDEVGAPMPEGLRIDCEVAVPLASGLGSSASATAAGLLAAHGKKGRGLHRRLGDLGDEDLEIGFVLAQQKFQILAFGALEQGFRLPLRAFFHRRPDEHADESELGREHMRRRAQAAEVDEIEFVRLRVDAIHAVRAAGNISGIE